MTSVDKQHEWVSNNPEYVILPDPVYAGAWKIGGSLFINVRERATDEQIKHTEEYFGWEWVEA
jgi:hypothetical protein